MEGNAADITTVIQSMVTQFTSMAGDAMNGISQVVPAVLPVLAAIIVVGIIIKVVKRITGR